MPIRNAKVTLNGIDIQVDTNGVKPYAIAIVDDSQDWLTRSKLLTVRNDDDTMKFEVQTLSGKRRLCSYSAVAGVTVPPNDNASINNIYRRYLEQSYQLAGQGMARGDAQSLYSVYMQHQHLWASRQVLLAQLQDPDVTVTTRATILSNLAAVYADLEAATVPMILMGSTLPVYFGEGQTFQISDWVIGAYVDFSFTLVYRTLLTV